MSRVWGAIGAIVFPELEGPCVGFPGAGTREALTPLDMTCTMIYYAMPYYTILYYTILYYAILN